MEGMSSLDTARPRRRAFWADARFFLGIALIVASIIGVWAIVGASRTTAEVFAATRTLVPGEVVSADELRVVDVALGSSAGAYLAPGALDDGLVVVRTVAAGELVPVAATGDADAARTTTIVVRSAIDVPESISTGSLVEVWAAPPTEQGRFGTPSILVADATVVSVTRDDTMIGGGEAAVELVIPRADVAATLTAIAGESALSVIPSAVAP